MKATFAQSARSIMRGFTLLEVMIALAIFAMMASMLILVDGNSIKQARYQQEKVLASQIADHYLTSLHATNQWQGAATIPQVQSYVGYQWTVLETFELVSDDLRAVTVAVYLGEPNLKKATPLVQLTSWLRKPEAPHE